MPADWRFLKWTLPSSIMVLILYHTYLRPNSNFFLQGGLWDNAPVKQGMLSRSLPRTYQHIDPKSIWLPLTGGINNTKTHPSFSSRTKEITFDAPLNALPVHIEKLQEWPREQSFVLWIDFFGVSSHIRSSINLVLRNGIKTIYFLHLHNCFPETWLFLLLFLSLWDCSSLVNVG